VTAQPGPFSELENDCPYINNILVLPPNLGVITSLSNKEVISTSPFLSLKYVNFSSWTKNLPKIFAIYSSVEIYWRMTSPLGLYHEENNT
jgi:hypothetical protein